MQVWQFAAKRSQLPPHWNVLYGSFKSYLSKTQQKGWKRQPSSPPTSGRFSLLNQEIDPEVETCPPPPQKEEMDKSLGWNELSGEWWNCRSKCLPPTVCKLAVSKSRPVLKEHNCTAPHDPKAQLPTSPHKTDMTPFFLNYFFPSPHTGLISLSGRGCGSVF